jgi:beta-glucosidase
MRRFPDGFLWGTATAAYQIEGAHDADGRAPSIWDTFAHTPGKVRDGDTGDVACDHYHRFRDDVALMAELGLDAYRFSVSWPRVLPSGTGAATPRGSRSTISSSTRCWRAASRPSHAVPLGSAAGAAGSRRLGQSRHRRWFGEYAALMGRTLGDRVKHWITFNEPFAFIVIGHAFGIHAPGLTDPPLAFQASHHMNLAHGDAVRALRATVPGAVVGITQVSMPCYPASDSEADRAAARRYDGFVNRWYWEPPLTGAYPADVLERLGPMAPRQEAGDAARMSPPIDFFGHNSYTRAVVRDDPGSALTAAATVDPGNPKTAMGWEIYPDHSTTR